MVERIKTLTIMILDDEEDILTLYNDYLSRKGHRIIKTYVNSETILDDIEIERLMHIL
jgi:DNA-binding NtrC family response regulator